MSEQPNRKPEQKSSSAGMHIDVDHLSVTGHVVFAGRDGTVNVNTGGDVAQNTENSVTVGGVETTRESYDQMVSTIEQVEQKFEEEPDEDTKEAARHYFDTIKQLLLSTKKPNPKILISTVKSLAKLGPLFVSGVSEVFGEPLAAKIVAELGQGASEFFKAFHARFGA
jgi:hypothetical protein